MPAPPDKERTVKMQERLDRFISGQVAGISRAEAQKLIRRGAVSVGKEVCRRPERKISPDTDEITLNGERIGYKKYLYIMLNKPAGVVCSTRDGLSETVLALLPPDLRRRGLFPAGRLDKDTVGFVLITDDGALAHRLLSPKRHVDKKYCVRLRDPIDPGAAEKFSAGMELDGEKLLPAGLEITGERECYITLREGRYHQIKRMFGALGNEVTYLKRTEFAGIPLDPSLSEGQARELSPREEQALKKEDNSSLSYFFPSN